MKKILVTSTLALAFTSLIFAQAPAPGRKSCKGTKMTVAERIDHRITRMDKNLNLSDDQEKEIRSILTDFANQKMTCQERQDARPAIREKIDGVLTAEQKALREKQRAERKGKRNNCPNR